MPPEGALAWTDLIRGGYERSDFEAPVGAVVSHQLARDLAGVSATSLAKTIESHPTAGILVRGCLPGVAVEADLPEVGRCWNAPDLISAQGTPIYLLPLEPTADWASVRLASERNGIWFRAAVDRLASRGAVSLVWAIGFTLGPSIEICTVEIPCLDDQGFRELRAPLLRRILQQGSACTSNKNH